LSKLGQTAIQAITVEQLSTKLLFQPFDGIAQRWLRDTAVLGCTREVLVFAKCQKVANLMHFH
jgi:hypothetical protein